MQPDTITVNWTEVEYQRRWHTTINGNMYEVRKCGSYYERRMNGGTWYKCEGRNTHYRKRGGFFTPPKPRSLWQARFG
jgi:hypothetical protein